MFKWIKKLFKSRDYHLGTTKPPRPFPTSGAALVAFQSHDNLSPEAKLAMVAELLEGSHDCPECGQLVSKRPLITKEQALSLLGFYKKN